MKRLYPLWIAVPAFIGLMAYGLTSGHVSRWSSMLLGTHPVLDCPNVLELGERELGDVAVIRFAISNRGGQVLVIDDVQSSCSCSGLEQDLDGKFVRLTSLRVARGESVTIAMRVLVQGSLGTSARYKVSFRSNDPSRPAYGIEAVVAKVNGGAQANPTSLAFGSLLPGSEARRVVDIYDDAVKGRSIGKAVSGSPDRVAVRVLNDVTPPTQPTNQKLGKWIGRIEVVALTETPARIQTDIELHLAGEPRPPTLIPVSGRVLGPVEISPSILLLPRSSDAGPVYFGRFVCRSTNGKPIGLSVDSVPQSLTVKVDSETSVELEKTVAIEWDRTKDLGQKMQNPRKVRLRARINGQETIVELPVFCVRDEVIP